MLVFNLFYVDPAQITALLALSGLLCTIIGPLMTGKGTQYIVARFFGDQYRWLAIIGLAWIISLALVIGSHFVDLGILFAGNEQWSKFAELTDLSALKIFGIDAFAMKIEGDFAQIVIAIGLRVADVLATSACLVYLSRIYHRFGNILEVVYQIILRYSTDENK